MKLGRYIALVENKRILYRILAENIKKRPLIERNVNRNIIGLLTQLSGGGGLELHFVQCRNLRKTLINTARNMRII